MRYGHFDDETREYVIERPDTPAPWINYLGEDSYCSLISNNAGGYSFRKSAGFGRILRYRFDGLPADRPGRYIYLRDEDGDYWSVSWAPVKKPLDRQQVICRHGLGYTKMDSRYRGIAAEATFLVPSKAELEIWRLRVTNTDARARRLSIFGYAEFGMPQFSMETDLQSRLFATFPSYEDGVVVYHVNHAKPGFHDAFMTCTGAVESFDTQRDLFIGPWRDEGQPLAVEKGRCSGSCQPGGNICGALQLSVVLEPGQTFETAFLVGSGAAEAGRQARRRYTAQRIEEELVSLATRWRDRLGVLECRTPDAATNLTVGTWNAYQAHTTFKWSRSASFIEAGGRDGYGFRDTLQDMLAVLPSRAPEARALLRHFFNAQTAAGSVLHKVQPWLLECGKGAQPPTVYSDDHLWLSLAVAAYIRETGEADVLNETMDFLDTGAASVYRHLLASLDFARGHIGPNGMLHGLAADWNDCINLGSKGESVWVSMLFCLACDETAWMAGLQGDADRAAEIMSWRDDMAQAINASAWDGGWYLRAILADGGLVGSSRNSEGAIFLNVQSWSILSRVADAARGSAAMQAAHDRLATPHGLCLVRPPYRTVSLDVGAITYYPGGQKENGSIFCHTNPWAIIAETMLGQGDRAFDYYSRLLPANRNDEADQRKSEPYVFTQFVKGPDDECAGEACNPWLTGTASWMYVAATQYILGIRPAA